MHASGHLRLSLHAQVRFRGACICIRRIGTSARGPTIYLYPQAVCAYILLWTLNPKAVLETFSVGPKSLFALLKKRVSCDMKRLKNHSNHLSTIQSNESLFLGPGVGVSHESHLVKTSLVSRWRSPHMESS